MWCESISALVSNCVVVGNSAAFDGGGVYYGNLKDTTLNGNSTTGSGSVGSSVYAGGGAYSAVLNNCALSGNTASEGGGADSCTLTNCTLTANSVSPYTGGGVADSALYNCILSNNSASSSGGGASSSTLKNCMLIGNSASNGGGSAYSTLYNSTLRGNSGGNYGGGTFQGTLYNCVLVGNSAYVRGGGAYESDLYNCTVISNSIAGYSDSSSGGGVALATLWNCIVYYNTAKNNANSLGALFYNCCTPDGFGNLTSAPLFVDQTAGNLHLQSDSPCINSGNNSYVATSADLDGNARISGGTVDIGAYEFQSPSSILSYAWAQQYGLPTDGSADFTDPDGDGLNNYSEWIAGTVPTNSLSVLTLFSPSNNAPGLKVSWQSVSGKNYFLQRSTNLLAQPAFTPIQSNLVGAANLTTYSDLTATNGGPYFYRIGVQ